MIFGIDFDGTIVEAAYPSVGELKPNAKKIINQLFEEGHFIVINTCRSGAFQYEAKHCLHENGINYHTINENLQHVIDEYSLDTRKISADVYIDDRSLGGIPDDWDDIYELIKQHPLYGK